MEVLSPDFFPFFFSVFAFTPSRSDSIVRVRSFHYNSTGRLKKIYKSQWVFVYAYRWRQFSIVVVTLSQVIKFLCLTAPLVIPSYLKSKSRPYGTQAERRSETEGGIYGSIGNDKLSQSSKAETILKQFPALNHRWKGATSWAAERFLIAYSPCPTYIRTIKKKKTTSARCCPCVSGFQANVGLTFQPKRPALKIRRRRHEHRLRSKTDVRFKSIYRFRGNF